MYKTSVFVRVAFGIGRMWVLVDHVRHALRVGSGLRLGAKAWRGNVRFKSTVERALNPCSKLRNITPQ